MGVQRFWSDLFIGIFWLYILTINLMADDKSKRDGRDRSKVSGSEKYEVQYESKKTGATPAEVREAIKKSGGNSREKVERELRKK